MVDALIIRPIASARETVQYFGLRRQVFHREQQISLDREIDDLDFADTTIHVVALAQDRVIGAGRILAPEPVKPDIASAYAGLKYSVHIGRLAVAADKRGGGIGAQLVNQMAQIAVNRWGSDPGLAVELSAQNYAVDFYRSCGYELIECVLFIWMQGLNIAI